MYQEHAECGNLPELLQQLGKDLDQYLRFEHPDAMSNEASWKAALGGPLPEQGIGCEQLLASMGQYLIPNGSQVPKPGCTAFITTGATSAGVLATLSGTVAAPQRVGLTAFNYLEELSLQWMAEMFNLPATMKGIYSSGGSVANLVALGAARQWAFERLGINPAEDGVQRPCRLYASSACHRTIHRAAAVLGMGRSAVVTIQADNNGRLSPAALRERLTADAMKGFVLVAIVANAGTTDTGAIDPLAEIGEIAREFQAWFHIDGAYGLPGILDPRIEHLYQGLELADSLIVDPHKWLGAPVGIGATFVRDRSILNRAFSQGAADYLEGACHDNNIQNSMQSMGVPYHDFGVELSAPSRGAVVWALIREIGKTGMRARICRHNDMAQLVADLADKHPNLEVVQKPTLSICCFRYISDLAPDLNDLNKQIHRQLVEEGRCIPSTTIINGNLVIRPCFVGARTTELHARELVDAVVTAGDGRLTNIRNSRNRS
ncbi:MAG: aminotransferase class V-fold PLP-dependent enzyme [Gammaproteobacteria bacterium]|jgi:aromatic-L-amino-acid/L-tryptophan decarboxylase|nr:aminotransferase class V-fold PLP-dependent enzyme [Gammaproteobacteria bacterium]MBT5222927.1 aminotransferase class V-fold PLP-dependent enzyme [Gammaproteobacteria bacterium]MBT5826906.1 aminotransferase class V-fold PLP-dependent enzyme [Gammaproteobacteria bacterium]MBT5966809.1 aminotransferase class V-fold PLP-dependent enzyme [Gammaproteobacteria bacterium]MBT6418976.1 aminotransferase class V-fold PLP-dependent enzyme [Gammaproteobacteria bacterium]